MSERVRIPEGGIWGAGGLWFMSTRPHNPFIILTNPRSGSSWVVSMLRSHDDLAVGGEFFNTNFLKDIFGKDSNHWFRYKQKWREENGRVAAGLNPFLVFRYLDEKLSAQPATGFKLMFKQMLKTPMIIPYIMIRQVSLLHLTRQNLLDVVISQETLKKRMIAHSKEAVEQVSVVLDPEKTVRWIKRLMMWEYATELFCKIMPVRSLRIEYESLVENPALWNEVMEFLCPEGGNADLQSASRKLNRLGHKDLIENYDALAACLRKNGLERFLDSEDTTSSTDPTDVAA